MCSLVEPVDPCVVVADGTEEGDEPDSTARPTDPPKDPGPPGTEPEEPEDPVGETQSIDAFNSLEDGQPGDPGHAEVTVAVGGDRGAGRDFGFGIEPEIAYTLNGKSTFARGAEVTGAVEVEGGPEAPETAVNLGWGERWHEQAESGSWVPTIAGLTELSVPVRGGPQAMAGSSVSETLTLAETLGPGAAYFNGVATGVLGADTETRPVVLGVRAGYQWNAVEDRVSVIVDYVREQNEERGGQPLDTAEVSMKVGVNDHLTLGPGLVFGLDRHPDTPRVGGGLLLVVE